MRNLYNGFGLRWLDAMGLRWPSPMRLDRVLRHGDALDWAAAPRSWHRLIQTSVPLPWPMGIKSLSKTQSLPAIPPAAAPRCKRRLTLHHLPHPHPHPHSHATAIAAARCDAFEACHRW